MPEPITCGCGCRFEPSADPGKPLICPRCMMVVLRGQGEINPVETAVAVAPEVAPTPPNPWVISAPPRRKGRKRSMRPPVTISLPFLRNPRQVLVAGILLVAGCGLLYFLIPSMRCRVLDAQRVDAYTALTVRDRSTKEKFLKLRSPGKLLPGGEEFAVTRKSKEGDFLLLHLRLAARFINARAQAMHGDVIIRAADFQLRGAGEAVTPLLLEVEYPDPDKGVVVDIFGSASMDPIAPVDRPPFTHEGEVANEARPIFHRDELLDPPGSKGKVAACEGYAEFKGKRGMLVKYQYQGSDLTLTWNEGSRGWKANNSQQHSDSFYFDGLELHAVFPRPKEGGKLTLAVFGEDVATVDAQ